MKVATRPVEPMCHMWGEHAFFLCNSANAAQSMAAMDEERPIVAGSLGYAHLHDICHKEVYLILCERRNLVRQNRGAVEIHLLKAFGNEMIKSLGFTICIMKSTCFFQSTSGCDSEGINIPVLPRVCTIIERINFIPFPFGLLACAGNAEEQERQKPCNVTI
jgi:hypothetical protein